MDSESSKKTNEVHRRRHPVDRYQRLNRWLLIVLILLVLGLFLFGGDGIWSSLVTSRKIAKLEARIDSLENLNRLMSERIEGLKKLDPQVLEEEARGHGLIKPGEKVYVMQPEKERRKK